MHHVVVALALAAAEAMPPAKAAMPPAAMPSAGALVRGTVFEVSSKH
jgi:hypothetical protein